MGLGTSPSRMMRFPLPLTGSGMGTAESRACVYGCSGERNGTHKPRPISASA